jgi:AcrR family transcriptional regulator
MAQVTQPPRDLRRRARDAVRAEIAETAFQLFTQHGFEETTVDDIALAAGLSRRSFFRYFASKEDAVLGMLHTVGDAIAAELAARPAGEPPWTSLRRALDVLVTTYLGDSTMALARFRLIHQTPALRTTLLDKQDRWQRSLAQVLAARLSVDPAHDLRPELLAATALAALDVASRRWLASDGHDDLATLLDEAFAVLATNLSSN